MALYEDNFDIFFINEYPKKQVINDNFKTDTPINSDQKDYYKILKNEDNTLSKEQISSTKTEFKDKYKIRNINNDYTIYDNAFDKTGSKNLLVEGKDRSLIITRNIDLVSFDVKNIFEDSLAETKIKEIAIAKVVKINDEDTDLYLICIHNDSNVTNNDVKKILDIINNNETVKGKYILGLDANTKNIMDYEGLENGIDTSGGLQFAPIINNVNNVNNTKGYTPYTTNKVRTLAQSQWSKYEVDKSIKDLIIVPGDDSMQKLKINSSNVLRISHRPEISESGSYHTYQCNTSACNELIPDNHHVFDHFISTANVKHGTNNHNVLLLNYSALQESPYEYETDDLKFFSQKIKAIAERTKVNKTYSIIRNYIQDTKEQSINKDRINLDNLYDDTKEYEFEHNGKKFIIPSDLSVFDFCSALNLKTPMEGEINKQNIQDHLKNPDTATTESRIFSGFNQHAKEVCELIDPLEKPELFKTFTQTGEELLKILTEKIINSTEYNEEIIKNKDLNKDLNKRKKYYIFRPTQLKTAPVNAFVNASETTPAPETEPVNILNYVIFYIIYCSIIIQAFNSCSPDERDIIIDAKNKINYVKPEKKAEALKNLFTKKFYIDTSTIEQQIINKQKQLENRIDTLFDLPVINKTLRDQKVRENLNPGIIGWLKRKTLQGYQQGVGTEVHIDKSEEKLILEQIKEINNETSQFFLLRTYPFNTSGFRNLINIRSNKQIRQKILPLAVTNEYGCEFSFKNEDEGFNSWARNTGLTYEEFNKILTLIKYRNTIDDNNINNYVSELEKLNIQPKGDKSKLHNFDEKTMINFNKCNSRSKAESVGQDINQFSNNETPLIETPNAKYKIQNQAKCKKKISFSSTRPNEVKKCTDLLNKGSKYKKMIPTQWLEKSIISNTTYQNPMFNVNAMTGGSKSKKRSKTRRNNRKLSRRNNSKLSRTNKRKLSRRNNKKISKRNNRKVSRRN